MNRFHFILTAALAATVAASAGAADLVLRERVTPRGPVIRLGEVASVLRATPEEEARLAAMPLMPAPAPGTQQVVRAQDIRNYLVAGGVDLSELRFDGAIEITIGEKPRVAPQPIATSPTPDTPQPAPTSVRREQSGYRLVTEAPAYPNRRTRRLRNVSTRQAEQLAQQVTDSVTDYVRGQTGDPMLYAMDITLADRNAKLLAAATSPLSVQTQLEVALGEQRFLISFETADGPVRFPVYADVQQAVPVVVAAAPIARGSVFTAANVRLEPLPSDARLKPNETPFTRIEAVLGKEAGRSIRPGTPLSEDNCLPPLLVRRGEFVDVIAGGNGLRISLRAKTKRDGRLGETVEVETLDGDRRLEARVVGRGELSVVPASASAARTATAPRNPRRFR